MPDLWHYTCDHGLQGIQRSGWMLRPNGVLELGLPALVWMTDLDVPMRDALGLTSRTLQCDRTQHRLQVREDDNAVILPWMAVRRSVDREYRLALEEAPGAMPRHWYVSTIDVHVRPLDRG